MTFKIYLYKFHLISNCTHNCSNFPFSTLCFEPCWSKFSANFLQKICRCECEFGSFCMMIETCDRYNTFNIISRTVVSLADWETNDALRLQVSQILQPFFPLPLAYPRSSTPGMVCRVEQTGIVNRIYFKDKVYKRTKIWRGIFNSWVWLRKNHRTSGWSSDAKNLETKD